MYRDPLAGPIDIETVCTNICPITGQCGLRLHSDDFVILNSEVKTLSFVNTNYLNFD